MTSGVGNGSPRRNTPMAIFIEDLRRKTALSVSVTHSRRLCSSKAKASGVIECGLSTPFVMIDELIAAMHREVSTS
jgi:hypothetical protein